MNRHGLLRRRRNQDQFDHLAKIPFIANEWFHTNLSLHEAIEDFCDHHAHELAFQELQAVILSNGNSETSCPHELETLHETFVRDVIDAKLSEFRLSQEIASEEEFSAILRLSQQEENNSAVGVGYFRWMEAASLEGFLVLMSAKQAQPSVAAVPVLLSWIDGKSESAKCAARRQQILRPLMTWWSPSHFAEVSSVLDQVAKDLPSIAITGKSCARTRQRVKALLRWKASLMAPVRREDGVYGPPGHGERDEESWLTYLEWLLSDVDDNELQQFVAFVEAYVNQTNSDAEQKDRRAAMRLFDDLDQLKTGGIYFQDIVELLIALDEGSPRTMDASMHRIFADCSRRDLLLRKLRVKIAAEEKSDVTGGSLREAALRSVYQESVGAEEGRSLSSASVLVSEDETSHLEDSILLNTEKMFRYLKWVFERLPVKDAPYSHTFRHFVVALHRFAL